MKFAVEDAPDGTYAQASPSPVVSASPLALRARAAVVFGLWLLVSLVAFRVEKLLAMDVPLSLSGWGLVLLPELAFVLVVEGFFLALAPTAHGVSDRVWRAALVTTHLLVWFLALAEHQFFMTTGSPLKLYTIAYSLRNLGDVHGIIGDAADHQMLLRAGLVALAALAAWNAARQRRSWPVSRMARLLGVTLLAGGLVMLAVQAMPSASDGTRTQGRSAAIVDLLDLLPTPDEVEAGRFPYTAPEVTGTSPEKRPNILLVVLESTRADVIRPGRPDAPAPFLSDLAGRGVAFDAVHTTVSHTSKALTGILCGMYPRVEMGYTEATPGMVPLRCLPHLLEDAGYRTAFYQSAFGSFENREGLIGNVGFQEWKTGEDFEAHGYQRIASFNLDDAALIDPAMRFMTASPGQPFFLSLLTVIAHTPYLVPEEAFASPPVEEWSRLYPKAIRYVDGVMAQLWRRMEEAGLTENTVVVFVGDHGEAFGEHRRHQHDGVPYREVAQVPLFFVGPESLIGPPRRIGGYRSQVDLLPTLLDTAGISWQGQVPGRNLFKTEGHAEVPTSCWYRNMCMSLVRGGKRYVYRYEALAPEVYDLEQDPYERHDLAAQTPPEELRSAIESLLRWKASVNAFYD